MGLCRGQLVEVLRQHNLTLQNYASIREQSIGGFIQVHACFLIIIDLSNITGASLQHAACSPPCALHHKMLSLHRQQAALFWDNSPQHPSGVEDCLQALCICISMQTESVMSGMQVSAHGTGATIPPVDEQVVAMKLVSVSFTTHNTPCSPLAA